MKPTFILSLLLLAAETLFAQIQWTGASSPVININPPAESGLTAIYVLPTLDGVSLSYTPISGRPSQVKWSSYSSLGGGYAQKEFSSVEGTASVLSQIKGDTGYIIEDGTDRRYIWVVDYSSHPFSVSLLTESQERECGRVVLNAIGSGDEIVYYSINGRRMVLSRDITLSYTQLQWDSEMSSYITTRVEESLESLPAVIRASAPLCATDFTLSGDRFLRQWGRETVYTSASVEPHSVDCHTSAVQSIREAENEINPGAGGNTLGGSAPCEVTFSASVTDAAIFREWQFSHRADFEDIFMREPDLDFSYTFTEQGSVFVRFYCANADASCDAYGETYEISIGVSSLKCPNAFSPLNEDGVNDEWKVSYSSIVSFQCSIYNRYGREMISFTDPAAGWDGRYGGKLVPAGVYYYVIKARGADGKEYKLSGDINIVDYK